MPKGKGKRQPLEVKLAALLKKQVGYRSDPSTCENCDFSVPSTTVPEEKAAAVSGLHPYACTKHSASVVFGVLPGDTCNGWKKKRKRKPRKQKEEDGGTANVEKKAKVKKEQPKPPKKDSKKK